MLKIASKKIQLVVLSLLFSGSALASEVENMKEECRKATKDFITSIQGKEAGSLADNIEIHNAEFVSKSGMKVKTSYNNKQYETKCSMKTSSNTTLTVELVVDVE